MKFSKLIIAFVFITTFIFNAFGQDLSRAEADKFWQLLEKGDTENTFWSLTDLFRKNGAEIAQEGQWELKLKVQDYKEIINKYSNGKVEITVSRMMKPEETADYWENWSKVLAAGNFDHKKFFRNDRERFLLANYNVLVLSAHEIGHYLDFLYKVSDRDFGGGFLHDNDPLNCSENVADKFAVAVINELSKDTRFAEIRPRYLQLIKTFNATIPSANRYNFDSYEFVGKRCGEADLTKNGVNEDGITVNENFFRQYSSAYFNRHRLMLENADYGDLAKVIKNELVEPYFKRLDYAKTKVSLKTLAEFDKPYGGDFFYGDRDFRDMLEFQYGLENMTALGEKARNTKKISASIKDVAFNEKGELRFAEINWLADKLKSDSDRLIIQKPDFTLKITDLKDKQLASFKLSVPKNLRNNFNVSNLLLPTDNEIILVMNPFDLKKKFDHLVILHLQKTKDKWNQRFVKFTLPDVKDTDEIGAGWFISPSGKLFLGRAERKKGNPVKFSVYEINRPDFTVAAKRSEISAKMRTNEDNKSMKEGLWRKYEWGDGVFGNDSGRLMIAGYERNLQLSVDSGLFEIGDTEKLVIGNMTGIIDGNDQRKIRITSIISPRFISENKIVFVDTYYKKHFIRELTID